MHRILPFPRVVATMIRRSADPMDSNKGPINAIEPVLTVPSHHGPDVQTVIPDMNIQTLAVKVPTTIMHLHSIAVDLTDDKVTSDDILDLWNRTPRIKFVKGAHGIKSTAQIMEVARDLNRPRGDFNEIIVWKDGAHVVNGTLYYYQAIHQESDVIPEIVDCIRAMFGFEGDFTESVALTDSALGIL